MRRRATFPGVVMILALVMAACAPAATATEMPTVSVPVTGDTATPGVVMTATSAETPTSAAPAESPTAEATTGATTDTAVRIAASSSTAVSEPFLVDQTGRTLYATTNDTQNSGASSCTAECLTEWPPVIVTGTPTAGTGVDASLLGTITRDDGTMQATYNGWPLYYYSGDQAAGAMNGQGMENSWFLVSATGNAIQQ